MRINTEPDNYPENYRRVNLQDEFEQELAKDAVDDIRDPLYNLDMADLLDTTEFFPSLVNVTTTRQNDKRFVAIKIVRPNTPVDFSTRP